MVIHCAEGNACHNGDMITRITATNYRCLSGLDFQPNKSVNIIVGDNEAGKSTLLEVISLVVTGRVRGRWASEDLNPYWFNHEVVAAYFEQLERGQAPRPPTIDLEVYFDRGTPGTGDLIGIHNTQEEDCPGLRLKVIPDPEQLTELTEYMAQKDIPALVPTDLFIVDWRSFAGEKITRQPRGLGVAALNSNTVTGSAGVDFKMKQMIRDFVTPAESAQIALKHRQAKADITGGVLKDVNSRIEKDGESFGVSLQMDQSANSSWDMSVTPHMQETPFSLLGHGRQVETKIALAMSRSAERSRFVLVEEPENHLSHTALLKVLKSIETLSGERQLFITTHSSFVLNRLRLDKIQLMHESTLVPLKSSAISEDTIKYFQKQSGHDTLRLAIARKAVVVEGASDEMIFNRAYQDLKGVEPRANGIDVITLGTRGKRALELAKALNKTIAVLRDNDGKSPEHWRSQAGDLLLDGTREMFVGTEEGGVTLENQLSHVNTDESLRISLGIGQDTDPTAYMLGDKTEAAWRLANAGQTMRWPSYITDAVEFIHAK